MFSDIIFEKEDKIAIITLNKPQTNNTLTENKIISDIEKAIELVNQDKELNVLILKANGKVFSAGGNLNDMNNKNGMFSGEAGTVFENYEKNIQRIPRAFYSLSIPSIAVVDGAATGAGCDLAFMCDMRIASKKAWFAQSFINVGLISGDGGVYFLSKIANHPLMAEMIFTGGKIDAKRAYYSGLVNRLVENDEIEQETLKFAEQIASKPPKTIRFAMKLLKRCHGKDLESVLYQSGLTQSLCHNTRDHKEAVRAFLEKRTPEFKGE